MERRTEPQGFALRYSGSETGCCQKPQGFALRYIGFTTKGWAWNAGTASSSCA